MKKSYQDIRDICLKPEEAEKQVYTRVVTHGLSTRLIWLCQRLEIEPNTITLFSLIAAFLALPFFLYMTPTSVLLGALFVELYYVLDAVDGQWSRLKKRKSLTGAFFDVLINYALQPFLFCVLGWGVYFVTGNLIYVFLGFLGGMSSIWVLMIWNLRASVLLAHFKSLGIAPQKPSQTDTPNSKADQPLANRIFSVAHKSLVFPWLMSLLSVLAVLSFVFDLLVPNLNIYQLLFQLFLAYYGILGPIIATTLTIHWIKSRKIDHATELSV